MVSENENRFELVIRRNKIFRRKNACKAVCDRARQSVNNTAKRLKSTVRVK